MAKDKATVKYIRGPADSWLGSPPEAVSGGMGNAAYSNPATGAGGGTEFSGQPPAGLSTYCRKSAIDDKTFPITIGGHTWQVSLARDTTKGLSGTKSLETNAGMLFNLMGNMPRVPINMQEMKYSLDIIFITQNEKVAKVFKDVMPMANVTYSGDPVHYFLEVNAGEAYDLVAGNALKTDINALHDNMLQKSKVYVEQGEQPKGKFVQQGPRGGKFYENTISETKPVQIAAALKNALGIHSAEEAVQLLGEKLAKFLNDYASYAEHRASDENVDVMFNEIRHWVDKGAGLPFYGGGNIQESFNRAKKSNDRNDKIAAIETFVSSVHEDNVKPLTLFTAGQDDDKDEYARKVLDYLRHNTQNVTTSEASKILNDRFNEAMDEYYSKDPENVEKQFGTTASVGFCPTAGGGGGESIDFYGRQKIKKKIDDLLAKAKIYLEGGEQPPNNEAVQTGGRGGKYYESTGHAAAQQSTGESNTHEQQSEPKVDAAYTNIPEEINAIAKQLADKASQLEPRFTHDMQTVATATGGKLHQLEFNKKSAGSIARKIVEKQHENPELSIQQVAMQLRDLNRYTLIFEHGEYCNHVLNAQQKLSELGYKLYDHKQKKYFKPNEPYHGYNTSVIDANGNIFELQYHTNETATKQLEGHVLYEKFRVSQPGPERDAIYHRMQQMWEGFVIPEGIENLVGELL